MEVEDPSRLATKALDLVERVTYTMELLSRSPLPALRSTTWCGNVKEMDGFHCCGIGSIIVVSRSSRNDATNDRELWGVVCRALASSSAPLLLDLRRRFFLGDGRDMEVSVVAHGNSSIFIFFWTCCSVYGSS